jgi:hypothetical protein
MLSVSSVSLLFLAVRLPGLRDLSSSRDTGGGSRPGWCALSESTFRGLEKLLSIPTAKNSAPFPHRTGHRSMRGRIRNEECCRESASLRRQRHGVGVDGGLNGQRGPLMGRQSSFDSQFPVGLGSRSLKQTCCILPLTLESEELRLIPSRAGRSFYVPERRPGGGARAREIVGQRKGACG